VGTVFEPPVDPEYKVNTSSQPEDETVGQLLKQIRGRRWLS
jgi:adenylylsulfate kinase-like enzyme